MNDVANSMYDALAFAAGSVICFPSYCCCAHVSVSQQHEACCNGVYAAGSGGLKAALEHLPPKQQEAFM